MSQFNLSITLGNEAMSSRLDILEALYDVINELQEFQDSGTIFDINGNTVGSWKISK